MSPIEYLKAQSIPTHSYIKAVQYINARWDTLSGEDFESKIRDLMDNDGIEISHKHARYVYLYLVQEIIRTSFSTDQFDLNALLSLSVERAMKFVGENEYVFAEKDTPVKLDSKGKPKKKKGWKRDEAERMYQENKGMLKKDFMDLLIKELDMTKAGAQTYFYNCKKKFGV